jgi:hypothetical protein
MAHRFDGDPLDDLAIAYAVNLCLQIHPGADMDGQDLHAVAYRHVGICVGH